MQVVVDIGNLLEAIPNALKDALNSKVGEQILQDCNYFCLQDQGTLIGSSIAAMDGNGMEITWNTPYARRRYYEPTPRTGVNPNAKLHWAEEAAKAFSEDWALFLAKEASL